MAEIQMRRRASNRIDRIRNSRRVARLNLGIVFLLVLVMGSANPVWARTSTPTARVPLKKMMTVDAYDQAGLNRLTAAQRRALEVWLARHLKNMSRPLHRAQGKGAARVRQRSRPSAASRFGLPRHRLPAISNSKMVSHIKGVFRGWNGNTRFHLTNGEIWVQADSSYFRIPPVSNPRVEIKKLAYGYVLQVQGYGEQVFVTRVP